MNAPLQPGRIVIWRESDVVDGMVRPLAILAPFDPANAIPALDPATPMLSTTWPAQGTAVSAAPPLDLTESAPSWEVRASGGGWHARPATARPGHLEARWFPRDEWDVAVRWADLHARRAP